MEVTAIVKLVQPIDTKKYLGVLVTHYPTVEELVVVLVGA
jgi:hypothetical protein